MHRSFQLEGRQRTFSARVCLDMGNKIEKTPLDQQLLDKLMEETGLEREVIIAWRFGILLVD